MSPSKSALGKRACRVCGKKFTPSRSNNVNCSRTCGKRWENAKVKSKQFAPKDCEWCGTEFTPDRDTGKFCSRVCARTATNAKANQPAVASPVGAFDDTDLIAELQGRGFRVDKPERVEKRHRLAPKSTRHYRLGVVSDTHLGSKHQQLTYLHEFYDLCASEGIETVVHVGDLVHGSHKMHRDMVLECHVHGADAQTEYAVNNYPKRDGISTLLIAGNHDQSFWDEAGVDVCRQFAEARDDVMYLGQRGGYLEIGGVVVYLWHPRGGGAYALSYKLQKWIEQVAPESKPHILLVGHWHSPAHVVAYRNVEGLRLPCFQSETPFERTLGLHPVVGGLVLDIWASEGGLEDMQTRWVIRRVPIPDDF